MEDWNLNLFWVFAEAKPQRQIIPLDEKFSNKTKKEEEMFASVCSK